MEIDFANVLLFKHMYIGVHIQMTYFLFIL